MSGKAKVYSFSKLEAIIIPDDKPADFETAITASGFGKFNIILYIVATAAGWSSVFETTTMSFVFPAAECDLNLKLSHKGLLNAVTYSGMICSAVIWGFLCDTLGRKKLLLIGYFLDALFFLMAASSQSFTLLMIAKFLGGFIITGPFAALTAYLSEFHNAQHRARVQMILGTIFSIGNLVLPLLALGVFPLEINVKVFNYFVFHSWNLYLLICSLPALISAIAFLFLPESPKFLMTMGRNEKALQVFRKVYRINTGKPEHTFPITELVDETISAKDNPNKREGQITANRTKTQALKEGWQQMKPLFFPPHLGKMILVVSMQCFIMMSLNTLRLWLPQIFQAISDYQYYHNETTTSLCEMMEVFQPNNGSLATTECTVNYNNIEVYTNSMIVAFASIVAYIAAGTLINTLGKKQLLCILGVVSGIVAMTLYFSRNMPTTVALSSLFISFGGIGINVILAVVVDLFPTTLRTMTVSLTMMFGRIGATLGNLVFPFLLESGCAPPFFSVGAVMLGVPVSLCLFNMVSPEYRLQSITVISNVTSKITTRLRLTQRSKTYSNLGTMTNCTTRKTFFISSRKKENCEVGNEVPEGPVEFETAISALGFGKFNITLFLILIPSQWTLIFDAALMAYISPIAECDLNLSLSDKGNLNAAVPSGGIIGAVIWGVLLDTLGRRKLILYGYVANGIIIIITSLSQSYLFLLILKFVSGGVSGGLYIAVCTYYAEFHSMKHRSKMQIAMGFVAGGGYVALPLLSSFLLPMDFTVILFNGYIKFHSWNLLILVSSVLSFMTGIIYIFLPETPKYLMTEGNNEEALAVFRKVYTINSGKPEDTYPIAKLINEQKETREEVDKENVFVSYMRNGLHQIAPLFNRNYFPKLMLVTVIEFIIITNMNTLRLWLPQIFQAIHEYQASHNGTTSHLCTMLETLKGKTSSSNMTIPVCSVNTDDSFSVYLNSMVNAIVCMVGYAMAGTLINILGKKRLLCILGLISGTTVIATYWSQNTFTTLALTSLSLAVNGIGFDVVMTIIVVIFPTTLRATAISTMLMIGRSGIILGSVLFPILLQIGCAPPFFALGGIAIAAIVLYLLLPNTDTESLK
ncbi:hypothetical protein NQ315_012134 [Exocentrus adspersus]|uniref:Major facilitator superfamily (MFS) profile domain-containing protein n=1 Tax=Exocentrus adspersus TaxID=1586481 RepID=A0AAV8VXZ2_9CUCU|nr:hypothetical protein NQ315_012134 [Exocentrus adspersus]